MQKRSGDESDDRPISNRSINGIITFMIRGAHSNRFLKKTALLLILSSIVTTSCIVTAATPSITARSLSPQVTFGDSLSIECTISLPPGYRVEGSAPVLPANTVPSWRLSETDASGTNYERLGFLFYALEPDTLIVGPFQFTIADATGERSTVSSNAVSVLVNTVLAAGDSIPLPNRPPMSIKGRGIPGWLIILAIVLLIATIALIYYYRTRKSKDHQAIDEPIDEIGEFLKIKELGLHEKGRLKDLYVLISAALRGFIHRNMAFHALFETTSEITRELAKSDYSPDISNSFGSLLNESDMVLFARHVPSWEQSSSIIERALIPVKAVLDENTRRAVLATSSDSASDINGKQVLSPKTVADPVSEEESP
jgi:hypothetical protein